MDLRSFRRGGFRFVLDLYLVRLLGSALSLIHKGRNLRRRFHVDFVPEIHLRRTSHSRRFHHRTKLSAIASVTHGPSTTSGATGSAPRLSDVSLVITDKNRMKQGAVKSVKAASHHGGLSHGSVAYRIPRSPILFRGEKDSSFHNLNPTEALLASIALFSHCIASLLGPQGIATSSWNGN